MELQNSKNMYDAAIAEVKNRRKQILTAQGKVAVVEKVSGADASKSEKFKTMVSFFSNTGLNKG
jgi:hypothetical protein